MMHSGKKKAPLHIAMTDTIHNICKSKKLMQIMNKLGLSMSYEEMERVDYALTHRIIKQAGNGRVPVSTSICSSNIIHGVMDNLMTRKIQWMTRKIQILVLKGVMTQ